MAYAHSFFILSWGYKTETKRKPSFSDTYKLVLEDVLSKGN